MADTASKPDKTDKVYKRDYVLMKEVTGEVVEVPIDKGMVSVTQAMLRGCVQTSPEAVAAEAAGRAARDESVTWGVEGQG